MIDPVLNMKIATKTTLEKLLGGDLDIVFAVLSYLYKNCFNVRDDIAECTVDAIRGGVRLICGRNVTDAYIRQILQKLREHGIVECEEARVQVGNSLRRVNIWRPKPLREVHRKFMEILDQIKRGTEEATNEILTRLTTITGTV